MADERDWDRELAKIDKLMGPESAAPPPRSAGQLPAPSDAAPMARPAERASRAPAQVAPVAGGGLRVWLTTLLAPIGITGLAIWPYPMACGTGLWVYMVGVLAVVGASLMTMRAAWQHRRGVAMSVGILSLIASLALAAMIVLPRVGYAAASLSWSCST